MYNVYNIQKQSKKRKGTLCVPWLEQVTGIEPAYLAWEASALPLSYTCKYSVANTVYHTFFTFARKKIVFFIIYGILNLPLGKQVQFLYEPVAVRCVTYFFFLPLGRKRGTGHWNCKVLRRRRKKHCSRNI